MTKKHRLFLILILILALIVFVAALDLVNRITNRTPFRWQDVLSLSQIDFPASWRLSGTEEVGGWRGEGAYQINFFDPQTRYWPHIRIVKYETSARAEVEFVNRRTQIFHYPGAGAVTDWVDYPGEIANLRANQFEVHCQLTHIGNEIAPTKMCAFWSRYNACLLSLTTIIRDEDEDVDFASFERTIRGIDQAVSCDDK
ncbi:MAG: hypothetical protein KJ065_07990 [Anaerolineae bacterium]|nr:hypothetical protein [Anaerolineae bacterium]